jgi:dTDP-4-amino-4,6-dideoxygalactose transaminase
MSDINAALGLSQLYRLKSIIKKRNHIAEIYFKLLKDLPIKLPIKPNSDICSFHLFIIQIDQNKTKIQRDQLFNFLRKKKVYTNLHYAPVHLQPFYFKKKCRVLPNSLFYSKNAMSIPVFERLSFKDQKKIVHIIKQGLQVEKNI